MRRVSQAAAFKESGTWRQISGLLDPLENEVYSATRTTSNGWLAYLDPLLFVVLGEAPFKSQGFGERQMLGCIWFQSRRYPQKRRTHRHVVACDVLGAPNGVDSTKTNELHKMVLMPLVSQNNPKEAPKVTPPNDFGPRK